MMKLSDIISVIKQRRKVLGLDQKDMLMLIGMSQQQYQRIESGSDLKVSTLLRILEGLKISLTLIDNEKIAEDYSDFNIVDCEKDDFWDNELRHLKDD